MASAYANLTFNMEVESECNFYELLINSVRSFKSLYDKRHPLYHNKGQKEKNWVEISKATGKSVGECKNRWKLLRERFTKELKKKDTPSGSGACEEDEWAYFQQLVFLKDHVRPRETRNNNPWSEICEDTEDVDVTGDNGESSTHSTCTETRKKRKNPFEEVCNKFQRTLENFDSTQKRRDVEDDVEDDVDITFMKSILGLMKGLPNDIKDVARTQIFNIIMKLRREHIH